MKTEGKSEENKEILLIDRSSKTYFVESTKDFHSNYGMISKEEILKAKEGDLIKTNKNYEFFVVSSFFVDKYNKIKRLAQIIPKKDLGIILSTTLVGKDDVCVDAGSGSGAAALFLARYTKKVISFDLRSDHQEVAKKNAEFLNIKNVKFKIGNIYEKDKINEKNISLILLDVPEPWLAIDTALKILNSGGFIVAYTPTIIQNADFVNSLKNKRLIHLKTVCLFEQQWEIDGRRIRPKNKTVFHSGFLSFVRKI